MIGPKLKSTSGTSGYLAPERIDPEGGSCPTYTVKADVWSLGITLLEVALSSFPFVLLQLMFVNSGGRRIVPLPSVAHSL